MDRRKSIKILGATTLGSALLADACSPTDKNKQAGVDGKDAQIKQLPGVQDFEHERNNHLNNERFFSDHEMTTISLLADIIFPKDDFSGIASDAGVPAFIEFMVKDIPDYQLPMRGGLKWLDVQCLKKFDKDFVGCKQEQQLEMIEAIAYPARVKPEMQQGAAFFDLMRNLTASGFFTSEMGVKDIGYLGNRPQLWEGVPKDVMKQYGFTEEDNS